MKSKLYLMMAVLLVSVMVMSACQPAPTGRT